MKIAVWLEENTAKLVDSDIESARLDCLLLLAFVLGQDKTWILANQNDYLLASEQIGKLNKLVARRAQYEPIAYITGRIEFYGLEMIVDKNVLVPRPETESLVETAARLAKKGDKIIDVGTGSGAIGLAVKYTRPDLHITLSDISPEALDVARKNADKYSLHDIEIIRSDLMNDINQSFDIIIANLPYLEKNMDTSPTIKQEPDLALFSPDGGLHHYKKLIKQIQARQLLSKAGYLILEAKPSQHAGLTEFSAKHGFTVVTELSQPYMLVFTESVPSA